MPITVRVAVLAAIVLAFPAAAFAGTSAGQPTPTNLDTVADATQLTGLRVDLPLPNCAASALRCDDVSVLDTLDGFNIQPRLTIPFSGPIDLSTVSSSNIFLIGPRGHIVGIDQAVWEPLNEYAARRERRAAEPGLDVSARRHARRPRRRRQAARHDDLPTRPQLRPDQGPRRRRTARR